MVAQEHVNDPPFPSLSSYDGIPPNKTYQAAALINAARNTGGSISEVCCRRWNLRPVAILVNERPDGTQVSHGILDSKIENLLREKMRLTALLSADEQTH